jgi:hypothetical protein
LVPETSIVVPSGVLTDVVGPRLSVGGARTAGVARTRAVSGGGEMSENGVADEVEEFLRERSRELTTARPGECLACFVARMLRSFGCDTTLRWAREFRGQRAPRATALERRLESMGGFCDCEIFLNGISMIDRLLVTDPATGEPERWPKELPSCEGVRPGSTRWCGVWERARRW